ncbi:MAG: hypothetical protein L3J05_03535, partial [Robiginitomaculum sp.]|nr:hypothetical protein [Robiginitomaculum sp.]
MKNQKQDKRGKSKSTDYDKVPEGFDGDIYTCPMHAEVRDVEKSNCPICGMFLTKEGESGDNKHDCCATNPEAENAPAGKYDLVPAGYKGTIYVCPMTPEV